jgi:hypothetical protein
MFFYSWIAILLLDISYFIFDKGIILIPMWYISYILLNGEKICLLMQVNMWFLMHSYEEMYLYIPNASKYMVLPRFSEKNKVISKFLVHKFRVMSEALVTLANLLVFS